MINIGHGQFLFPLTAEKVIAGVFLSSSWPLIYIHIMHYNDNICDIQRVHINSDPEQCLPEPDFY